MLNIQHFLSTLNTSQILMDKHQSLKCPIFCNDRTFWPCLHLKVTDFPHFSSSSHIWQLLWSLSESWRCPPQSSFPHIVAYKHFHKEVGRCPSSPRHYIDKVHFDTHSFHSGVTLQSTTILLAGNKQEALWGIILALFKQIMLVDNFMRALMVALDYVNY